MIQQGQHSEEIFTEAAMLFLNFKELQKSPEKALILAKGLQRKIAPESSIGYKLEAMALLQMSDPSGAFAALQIALEKDPKDEWILENMTIIKISSGEPGSAAAVVEKWIETLPDSTKPLLVMGYIQFKEKNYAGALPYVQKIIQIDSIKPLDPLLPEALNLLGQIHWELG
jgi:tetratricopeptide (TPR) repeat protein